MSTGRKLLFVISFIIVDILLLCGILFIRDFTEKNVLKKEVNALAELEFTKDSYDIEVKCNGEYAIIERAIKTYLDDYATDVQSILMVRYDKKLNNMLNTENYTEDGPLFSESLVYLNKLRSDFNNDVDLLLEKVNEKDVNEYIYSYKLDDSDNLLYSNLLLESNLIGKINDTQSVIINERIKMNSYIDSVYDVLVYLKDNAFAYSIIDERIVFTDIAVENEYYKLIGKAKRIFE